MSSSSVIEGTPIVTVTYEGSLSTADMSAVRERLQEVVDEYGSASLLVEYGDIDWGRIEPKAAWKDVKSIAMLDDIEKCAVVTDQDLLRTLAGGAGAVVSPEVKTFAADERDEAVVWLSS